ncbi:MAG TPA: Gfo/Idh/MocA family oxidoreductase [Tepidisphaeraceae bacterium]|nr:Gfo/Idh/MocA family oxidoreductase [Tepidisphaeraceae bacterium]
MIHFALVGCGSMANSHAQILQKIGDCKVVALVDNVVQRAHDFKSKYFNDAVTYGSYERLLEAPPTKLDAVLLVTPHTLHYSQSKAALERGLHVLVEKPMVTSSENAYELWRTVKRTGKSLGITFQAPYCAEYQYLRQLRDAGHWGKVQIIQGWLAQGWMKGTRGTWRQDPALSGGGQLYDSGSHILNGMMWLMNDPVVEVSCLIDNVDAPVDINGVAIMKFHNGALGSVAIGGNSPGWNVGINIQTDRMQIKTGPHGGFLEITGDASFKYPAVPVDSTPASFTAHRNFVSALLGREELQAPVRYGVLLSVLMDAMYASANSKSPVMVEPVPTDID